MAQRQETYAKTVGIVGLGLIGGSFARAYAAAGWRVLAHDTDAATLEVALAGPLAGALRDEDLATCDLVILAAFPQACVDWLAAHAEQLGRVSNPALAQGPLVIDIAGVKGVLCERAFSLAAAHGFAFCGAHPMAGSEFSGYAYSRANMFEGAPMVLVPPTALAPNTRDDLVARARALLIPCRFGTYSVTTPAEHDRVIAFTSQLAHVVSNAYVKSPTARLHTGFSAGSYRDLTRVAHLNPTMWTELMMDNAEHLGVEVDHIITALTAYRDALAAGDAERLHELLAEGDRIKRALDDA